MCKEEKRREKANSNKVKSLTNETKIVDRFSAHFKIGKESVTRDSEIAAWCLPQDLCLPKDLLHKKCQKRTQAIT